MKDFFISYNKGDRQWAEWIAWELEQAKYTVTFQVWDLEHRGVADIDVPVLILGIDA